MIPPSYVRVLEAIIVLHAQGREVFANTIREAAVCENWRIICPAIRTLVASGMVDQDPIRGSLVPRVLKEPS